MPNLVELGFVWLSRTRRYYPMASNPWSGALWQ